VPDPAPVARPDHALTRLFSVLHGPGWVGGDSSYSTELPDGSEAFVCSDTLIGRAGQSGSATFSGIAHNSELFGSLTSLKGDYAGSYAAPQPLIPDQRGGGDQWQVASTFVQPGEQLVFVNEFAPQNGIFGLFTGRSGIAVLTVPNDGMPSFRHVVALQNDPLTQWGNAVLQDGSYSYVYGAVGSAGAGTFSGMKVARVPRGREVRTGSWQYWDGTGWVAGEDQAVTLPTVNELTGVVAQGSGEGYEAVSIPGSVFTDNTLDLSYACTPQGPWSVPVPVYSIPQVPGLADQIAYIPTFHPELSMSSVNVISYNVNSTVGLAALQGDIAGYQPHFVTLSQPLSSAPALSYLPAPAPPAATPETPVSLLLPVLAAALLFGAYSLRHRRSHRRTPPPEVPPPRR